MLTSSGFAMLVSLFTTYYLAINLAPIALGVLMTAEAFVELFRFFLGFGFNNSILKFASEHENGFQSGLNKAIGNALVIKAVMALPIVALIFLSTKIYTTDSELISIINIYIFVYLLESFSVIFGIGRRALGQFKLISGIVLLNKLIRLGIIAIVFYYTKDLVTLAYAFLIEKVIRFIISWLTTRKFIKIETDFSKMKNLLADCFGYAFVDPLQGIQSKIDRVMINSFLGPAAVAIYSIPAKLTQAIQKLVKISSNTFTPSLHNSLRKEEKSFDETLSQIFRLSNIAAVLSFYMIYFFADNILELVFADKYSESYPLTFLFAYLAAISILENSPELVFTTTASHKFRIFYKSLSMVLNVVLNLFFLIKFGIVGAIYSTIIANSIRLIIKYWVARNRFKLIQLVLYSFLPIFIIHFLNPYVSITAYIVYVVATKQIKRQDLKKIL